MVSLKDNKDLVDVIRKHPDLTRNDRGEECLPYAVVRGRVEPVDRSLLSTSVVWPSPSGGNPANDDDLRSNRSGVYREFALVEHKVVLGRSGFWYRTQHTLQEQVNQVPFRLVDPGRDHPDEGPAPAAVSSALSLLKRLSGNKGCLLHTPLSLLTCPGKVTSS